MAYVDAAGTNRAPAVIGVAAIHAALAAVVVTGLAGGVARVIPDIITEVYDVPIPKDVPPPPPDPSTDEESRNITKVVIPDTPLDLAPSDTKLDAADQPQDYSKPDETASGNAGLGDGLTDSGASKPRDPPKFKPVAPQARNGDWVTNNDYRSSWITRQWEGTAAFRLSIGADGKVKDCVITRSTGFDALDKATCTLVSRRAKFDPAKNDRGEAVGGSFSSAVRWQIPE